MDIAWQHVSLVLFDADGVIQLSNPAWRDAWAELLPDPEKVDAFLADLFAAEKPFLEGGDGFLDAVAEVLDDWGAAGELEAALAIWQLIDPDEQALALVRRVSEQGYTTGLATNQQPQRIGYMRSGLGYADLFDHVFVSCELGAMKPSTTFFQRILEKANLRPEAVVFIDDHAENISAARALGIQGVQFHLDEGVGALEKLLAPE